MSCATIRGSYSLASQRLPGALPEVHVKIPSEPSGQSFSLPQSATFGRHRPAWRSAALRTVLSQQTSVGLSQVFPTLEALGESHASRELLSDWGRNGLL